MRFKSSSWNVHLPIFLSWIEYTEKVSNFHYSFSINEEDDSFPYKHCYDNDLVDTSYIYFYYRITFSLNKPFALNIILHKKSRMFLGC